jgi:hypothetical protein
MKKNLGHDVFMTMRQPHENRGAYVYTDIRLRVIGIGRVGEIMKLRYLLVYRMRLGRCSRSKKGRHLIPNRLRTDWAGEQTLQELVGC